MSAPSKLQLLADQPEVMALAMVASVPASTIAVAFNEPERFLELMTLDELQRLQQAAARMAALQTDMGRALGIYVDLVRRQLEAAPKEA